MRTKDDRTIDLFHFQTLFKNLHHLILKCGVII